KKDRAEYEARPAIPNINENSPPILIVHGGKDQQVVIHHADYLADQLELNGDTHETFDQLAVGHVPRLPAMVEKLTYIKAFMNQVE
ncbi:alpha/beta hydrolase family protein, partial [Staphylococcus aureus]|uniref:alpha/beta hydrolase family protein n=1 Tax=Staphylococcus aureus TaxID=1280 RepID=UPI0010F3B95B